MTIIIKKKSEFEYRIEKTGKMNVPAVVYASDKLITGIKQDKTLEQARNVSLLLGIIKASYVLPDAHQGYGFPIGGVAAFSMKDGVISPGGVGYDINCGVRLLRTDFPFKKVEKLKKELINQLFRDIPAGLGGKSQLRLTKSELAEVLEKGSLWALEKGMATKDDIEKTEENGRMKQADSSVVSDKAYSRGLPQLDTLGSGNHFLEIQKVDEIYDEKIAKQLGISKENVVIMIHCGSRGLGHQVASDYITKMENKFGWENLPDRELINAPINSELGQEYLKAMCCAVNYAFCNRQIITHHVREAFKKIMGTSDGMNLVYDVAHNIAKIEKHDVDGKKQSVCIHRKGATRSFGPGREEIPEAYRKIGQPVIIPGSMGTASYLMIGTKEAEKLCFGSTAHGAGRISSRHEASRKYSGEQIKSELEKKGIEVKSASWKGLVEEAPQVYKDIDEVARVSHELGLARKVARLVPIAVMKG
ncbi:MAG: RtcB family protein [Candidatus Paceibacterota bacterium]